MKKMMAIFMAFLMIATFTACGNKSDVANEKTQLGTSKISVVFPEGFAAEEELVVVDEIINTISIDGTVCRESVEV